MSSAMMEGNLQQHSSCGGKPILRTKIWESQFEVLDDNTKRIILYKSKLPIWKYHSKSDINAIVSTIYDIASDISKDIPKTEIYEFSFEINNVINSILLSDNT